MKGNKYVYYNNGSLSKKKNVLTGTGEYYLTLIGYTSIKNIQKKETIKNTFKFDILNSYSLLVK